MGDVRNLQKQINAESGKLKRSEVLADERIYQAARGFEESGSSKQNIPAKAYRYLAELRKVSICLFLVVPGCSVQNSSSIH